MPRRRPAAGRRAVPRRRAAAGGGRAGALPARARPRSCGCRHDDADGRDADRRRRPADGRPRAVDLRRWPALHLRLGLACARPRGARDAGRARARSTRRAGRPRRGRWRTGDLAGAGEAAGRGPRAGGDEPVALVIAAEAASALGRPSEARRLGERALARLDGPIDPVFAGMPRSAVWPADAAEPPPTAATLFRPRAGGRGRPPAATRPAPSAGRADAGRPASRRRGPVDARALGCDEAAATPCGRPARPGPSSRPARRADRGRSTRPRSGSASRCGWRRRSPRPSSRRPTAPTACR